MEIGKRTEARSGDFQLPETVIHHILSFLSGKEAASTTVLSKSWYNSWLTRPGLDFDERYFRRRNSDAQSDEEFLNFVRRSMGRYDEMNLNIDTFRLCMNVRDVDSSSFAAGLIGKASEMGVTSVDIEYHPPLSEFLLPKELFESKGLEGLSVFGCRIILGEVLCLKLKSLRLFKVRLEAAMIRIIMEKCVVLENLFLSDCEGFKKFNVSKLIQLRGLTVVRQVTKPLLSGSTFVEFINKSLGSVDDRIDVSQFWKLNYLFLERVRLGRMLFSDFLNKFPCLEDLKVHYCDGCVRFNISSPTLKYISLAHTEKLIIQLVNVPNICKFKFSGSIIPSLSCATTSREWESDVTFTYWSSVGASWFLNLKNFLTELSPSKISLAIDLLSKHVHFMPVSQACYKPVVENLTLMVHSSASVCSALLDGIIWSFQPKVITQRLFCSPEMYSESNDKLLHPEFCKASNVLLQLLDKKLVFREISDCCRSTERILGWDELLEVNPEYFEDCFKEWRPLPRKTLFPEKEVQIRFRLRWGQPNHPRLQIK